MNIEEKNPIDIYFDMKEGRVKLAQKQESGVATVLNSYLAMLRVLYVVFQHAHWKCKGSNFYGNHLLFERLYKNVIKLADVTAEKLIGLHGNDALVHSKQLTMMSEMFDKLSGDNHFDNAKNAVEAFLQLNEDVYNRLKEMDEITLGLDDMIMSHASQAEEYLYLIKQAEGSSDS